MIKKQRIAKAVAEAAIEYMTKKGAKDALELVVALLQKELSKDSARIFVPRDLRATEKLKIKKLVENLAGSEIKNFSFQKDTTLLDGLKISLNDKVWDFSLSGRLKNLQESK